MLWSVIDTTPGSAGKKESESTRRIGPVCPVWDSIKSLVTIPFRAPRFTPCDSSPIDERMKIHLSLNSIEELKPWSRKEKKEAWRRIFLSMHRSPFPWIGYGIMFSIVFVVVYLFPSSDLGWIPAGIAGGIGGFIMSQLQLVAAIPLMKNYLEKEGIDPVDADNPCNPPRKS